MTDAELIFTVSYCQRRVRFKQSDEGQELKLMVFLRTASSLLWKMSC